MQPALSLKGRALRWLAQREHSRVELERKLRAHLAQAARAARRGQQGQGDCAAPGERAGPAESESAAAAAEQTAAARDAVPALLDDLAAKGFLNDERAAESLLAGRGSRLGPLRLRRELQLRGFGAELAGATVARSRADELARALALWQRKFGTVAPDARGVARQARFLAARGFSADVVARIVRGAADRA